MSISVIIPVFNAEEFIEKAVDSAASQKEVAEATVLMIKAIGSIIFLDIWLLLFLSRNSRLP